MQYYIYTKLASPADVERHSYIHSYVAIFQLSVLVEMLGSFIVEVMVIIVTHPITIVTIADGTLTIDNMTTKHSYVFILVGTSHQKLLKQFEICNGAIYKELI